MIPVIKLISVAILAVLTVILFACARDASDSLSQIRKKGEIRFAVSMGYIPFSFYGANKEKVGFDIDVAKEMARRLGVKAVFIDVPWDKIIETLRSGACDAIVSSMAITSEREALVDFTEPYYYSRAHLFVRKGAVLKKVREAKGKVIGCSRATTYEQDARRLEAGKVVLCENDEVALEQLVLKNVDAVITDEIIGMYSIRYLQMPIMPLGDSLRSEHIAVAVRKNDTALLKAINRIIKDMREKGIIRKLTEKTAEGKYR
ncbi:MAG: L-cystine-binding protein FliY [Syntrophus sp. SKADARSKE-3]|nr:L-cystine-binding protein FliY [Syntrophus sp. SKADARSKE-3]